ncbi:MAG: hypothetical protein HYZ93_02650 [Candidatus Omnitrophica bacterium]|nr:hypothetical protein [Candidatus Omnitrophota bacterium]
MKRATGVLGMLVLLAAVGLCFSGASLAADEAKQPKQQQESSALIGLPKEEPVKATSGRIASVDPQERLVTVKKGLLPFVSTKFFVDWRTSIMGEGGQRLSLGDLKAGDPVKVEYAMREGKYTARTISLQ